MCGAANPVDSVIKRHKLNVMRCNYKENRSGSCWYDSITFWINKALEEGTINLDQLNLKTKGERVTHPEVRDAVCNFLQSDNFIMKDECIKELFDGNKPR